MTKEERHLWYDFLKNYPVQFYRQKVIGNYIVDFYCSKAKLIVELDGSQHFQDDQFEYDEARTKYLKSLGLEVLRIPNNEIWDNFPETCEAIENAARTRMDPHQSANADSFPRGKPEDQSSDGGKQADTTET
jgi:very-short-patch-repair endonuclease